VWGTWRGSTRDGLSPCGDKKFRRLYREERLQVRRCGWRKRALGTRAPLAIPQGANQRCSLHFLSDAFADGRRFRILAVVDDFSRECLALVADTSLPGLRVVRELDVIIAWRGRPAMCVSDNGPELTGMTVLRFSQERQIEWHYIAPGKPTQNAFIESFNTPCAMKSSMRRCLPRSRRFEPCWRAGKTTTTAAGRTVPSGNRTPTEYADRSAPGPQGGGTLRYTEGSAPRPVAPPSHMGSNVIGTLPIAG
jgi:putative transposase